MQDIVLRYCPYLNDVYEITKLEIVLEIVVTILLES
jgi:hypothetical protein